MAEPLVRNRPAWSWALAGCRCVVSALAVSRLYFDPAAGFVTAALVIFLLYSVALLCYKPARTGIFSLLALFADATIFQIFTYSNIANVWLSACFYLYLLTATLVLYSPREVFMVVGVCIAFIALASPPGFTAMEGAILTGGAFACAAAMVKRDLEDQLERALSEAESLRQKAENSSEAERQRIAADFHDGPLQSFISIQMRLDVLRRMFERRAANALDELRDLQELAQGQVRELRAFVRSMRPVDVEGTNLAASVRRAAGDFQKQSGIPVTFVGGDAPLASSPELCGEVAQILREALHNVQKHARASRVAMAMERVGRTVQISVDDDGQGFSFAGVFTLDELDRLRIGPVSLRQRVRRINADLSIDSRPGRGSALKISVPL